MKGRITADEKRRMAEFANTPVYERNPEMLVPRSTEGNDE